MRNHTKLTAFIVNPSAGHGKCGRRWKRLHQKIKDSFPFEVITTKEPDEAEMEARKAIERGIERIFIVGGDGTINEVINGIQSADIEVGVIPFGTGNDLAKTLGIPNNDKKIANMLLDHDTWVVKKINVGQINNRNFVIACGIGFDGLVAKKANESRMIKRLGSLGYLISALITLKTFSPLKIDLKVDDDIYHIENGWLLAVGNAPYYGGGMKICPLARIDDDALDLCVVSNLSKLKLLRFMPKVYSGKHVHLEQYVRFYRGQKISIHCHGKAVAHADGELIDSPKLHINLCQHRINWLTFS